ncbi:MAG: TetR/AcrR family transcriptional regulator [Thermoanaerobaculales bacterium]
MEQDSTPNGDRHGGKETCERLLAAAVRLFAERGFEATSVRDITTLADCNVAAVNYHFGTKENLYLEAFRSILGELRDRRVDAIRRDMAAGDQMTLEGFLESFANAFMEPLVDGGRGELFMAFVSRELLDSHLPGEVFTNEFFRPLVEVSTEAMQRVGPPMDPQTVRLCLMSVVGQLLHVLKAGKIFLKFQHPEAEIGMTEIIRHIVRFSAGGIREFAADGDKRNSAPLVAEGSR